MSGGAADEVVGTGSGELHLGAAAGVGLDRARGVAGNVISLGHLEHRVLGIVLPNCVKANFRGKINQLITRSSN